MKNILLVDDEQQSIDVFKSALESAGYTVQVSGDGKSAIALCATAPFDIIFLDEMMPDMSGNDVVKALKSDEKTAKIPIIMLTNYNDDTLVKTALAAGAADYVLKYKMVPEDLVEKIVHLIGE